MVGSVTDTVTDTGIGQLPSPSGSSKGRSTDIQHFGKLGFGVELGEFCQHRYASGISPMASRASW
jgi:hypothetical protein